VGPVGPVGPIIPVGPIPIENTSSVELLSQLFVLDKRILDEISDNGVIVGAPTIEILLILFVGPPREL
jgi:hypothetical protein